MNNLGALYSSIGDYARAEAYHLEAKDIKEKALGREHPDYAASLNGLGNVYSDMGDYARAEAYHMEAKDLWEKALGREHPYYVLSLNNLGRVYSDMGDYAGAESFIREADELQIRLVNQNFSFLSEQQRKLYWDAVSSSFERSYSLAYFYPSPTVKVLNYNNTLFTKGLLLRTTAAVRDAIYSSGDETLIGQYEELGRLRQQIDALRGKDDGNREYIQTLETHADSIDKALAQASAAFRDLKADLEIRWQDVQASLKQDEAAVEFAAFRLYDKKWTNTTVYAALVLRPGMDAPVWIPLCEEAQIQELWARTQGRSSSEQARILYDIFGRELYSIVWKPLEQELQGVKTVYYSPSGLLHKISFNAIPAENGERLADIYDLNLVSSTREIVRMEKIISEATAPGSAVVYGGLQYQLDKNLLLAAAQEYRRQEPEPAHTLAVAPPVGLTRGGAWNELPATREESLRIHQYLNERNIPDTLYQDSLGNEESFKHLDGAKTALIHLATHGFFLEDVERNYEERDLVQRLGGGASKAVENPLLRSGLLLSGGNLAWTGNPPEGVEDGMLTAAEIAGLNLVGTKLVVLSACQTGLGDVNNSEGVFGLQRAFKLAGAETLIMSLWELDDAATSKLMDTFYQQWLSGKSKQEAFKEAQRQVRDEYPAPYYWASFVLMD